MEFHARGETCGLFHGPTDVQNLKTLPAEISIIDDLPPLNDKEKVLIEALGQLDDNCEAYRKAYGASGYSSEALRVQACRKVAEPHIQSHLAALRRVGFATARLTLQQRIEDERAFAERAEAAGNFGAAGQARDRINKLMGLYVERVEVSATDPLDTLKAIAQVSPEIAERLAEEHNIEWSARQVN